MTNRIDVTNELVEKMKTTFVENFEKTNKSMVDINKYLETIDINDGYKYDEFCSIFLFETENFIKTMEDSGLIIENSVSIIGNIMSNMVKHKINTCIDDDIERDKQILLHDLRLKSMIK